MRLLSMAVLAIALALTFQPRRADAFAACGNNAGVAPRTGTDLPKHPKIVVFDDREWLSKAEYSAELDGKPVAIKKTTKLIAPYYLTTLEVQSDKTGALVIFRGTQKQELAHYQIKGDLKLPGKTDAIAVTTRRFTHDIRHSTVKELYDALVIDLPELPMIGATVKIRRDDKVPWQDLELPINTGDFMEKNKNVIRIGALGCKSNYTIGLIEQGIDLEATVTLADGTTRALKLPSKRVTVPPAPKPDPRDP